MSAPCPVCHGRKSKHAQLCARCRPKAIAAGVNLLIASANAPALEDIATWAGTPSVTTTDPKLTDGQRRAFYAKANRVDKLLEQRIGSTKREALSAIGVASTNDLTQAQASDLIDDFENRIAQAQGDE